MYTACELRFQQQFSSVAPSPLDYSLTAKHTNPSYAEVMEVAKREPWLARGRDGDRISHVAGRVAYLYEMISYQPFPNQTSSSPHRHLPHRTTCPSSTMSDIKVDGFKVRLCVQQAARYD